MADTVLKSAVTGRIASALVGLGAVYMARKYGLTVSEQEQKLVADFTFEILWGIGSGAASAVSLSLAIFSKLKEKKIKWG